MNISNPEKKYNCKEHLMFCCHYHVIFCPKYRRKVLKGEVAVRLKELFYEVAEKYDFSIIELEVQEDHVHMIVDCNPRFGIMECVTKLKGVTSKTLREEFPLLKSRIPSLWTRSVFISTVGSVSLDVVKQYIENQKKR